ncbi:MAG: cation:proton antiporter [Streptosporangiaceae bacterium]
MTETSELSLVAIVAAGVFAPFLGDRLNRWIRIPGAVLEILLGILIGPVVLGWAQNTEVVDGISQFGLALLMFLAGYELEFDRIRGGPLRLAVGGWLCSVLLGLLCGFLLRGQTEAALMLGLALTTTALGTILPMMQDAGVLPTPFGAKMMAIGAVGEFGPIVLIALLLTSDDPARTGLLLVVFVVIVVVTAIVASRRRASPRISRLLSATLGTSAQLPIRLAMFAVVFLLWVSHSFGLDVLLGAFAAGIIERIAVNAGEPREEKVIKSKLEAIGFGVFIPFFFVVSGLSMDLDSLAENPVSLLLLPLFLVLFLLVRGVPTYVLARSDPDRRRLALLSSAALPLLVAITSIGTDEGVLRTDTAAALVLAGMLSVLIFPLVALRGIQSQTTPLAGTTPSSR